MSVNYIELKEKLDAGEVEFSEKSDEKLIGTIQAPAFNVKLRKEALEEDQARLLKERDNIDAQLAGIEAGLAEMAKEKAPVEPEAIEK